MDWGRFILDIIWHVFIGITYKAAFCSFNVVYSVMRFRIEDVPQLLEDLVSHKHIEKVFKKYI